MITNIEIQGQEDIEVAVAQIRQRNPIEGRVESEVREILKAVRKRGDEALEEMSRRFDGVSLAEIGFEVSEKEREVAWNSLEGGEREALKKAGERVQRFAVAGLGEDFQKEISRGVVVGRVHRPMDRVGIYVPGGRYPYPSTVLMTGIPARVAGVKDLVFCVPPDGERGIRRETLAATWLIGECRIFCAGGAQAIAAMAYGTETVPRCSMVCGPGNVYVATAKRLLSDTVKVDLEAGPSEVMVIVDGSADLSYAVADMLAQKEHDPNALAVMVSESREVLASAESLLKGMAEGLSREYKEVAFHFVWCEKRELAISFANALAPEHMEIIVDGAWAVLKEIKSAGCVFLGPYSAAALGDYIAGPSHVLPTAGTACRLSGLKAEDFRRTMNIVSYDRVGLSGDWEDARRLALLESLEMHALSIDVRMRTIEDEGGA